MTFSIPRSRRIALSLAALATLASAASAATHVKDDASFFGAPAAQQAEQRLAAIQQRGGPNVVIETFDQPPGATRDQIVNAPDAGSRTRAFEQLMDERAKANNADVYVLVNRTPAQIRVIERKAMQSRGLPAAERDRVASTMRDAFVQKQFDVGLANGVGVLTAALGGASAPPAATPPMPTQNAPAQARRDDPTPTVPPSAPTPTGGATVGRSFGGLGCCTIAGIGLLVVLAVAVFRRMSNRGPAGGANYAGGPPVGGYPPQGGAYPQQGGYPPQAGGGFGRGVAGGVLGGVLGSVLGNQISHGRDNSGSQSHGGGGGVFGGGDETRGTSQDTDYTSSSGGDFGTSNDSGGSSDYTSSSGGDFSGGGDSGGGGGDSGGSSGGDF